MAGISKAVTASTVSEERFSSINLGEPLHLQSQVENHVEPYELVELFYGSQSVSSNGPISNSSPSSPHTPPPQVIEVSSKIKPQPTYKCEMCNRSFKEASHFSKHKRGALCRKSTQKLAKRNRKKVLKDKEGSTTERKAKTALSPYKPYQCNLCGAKFLDKVNVELHLERTHHTRLPLWLQTSRSGGFACSECDLWLADKAQLRQHQIQHQHTTPNHGPPQSPISQSIHNHASLPNNQPNHQNDPLSVVQASPLPPQPPMPPPPPHPQYYFQPLQHIQTFTTNQLHSQLGPPSLQPPPPPLPQTMQSQQMPPVVPPQGHSVPAFIIPHSHNPLNPPPIVQPTLHNHQVVSNPCSSVTPQVVASSSNASPNAPPPISPVSESPMKTIKATKTSPYSATNNWGSRRNMCGECGLKFVDPINLELHLQRKHPNSSIVETIGLSGGLTLYKTIQTSLDNTIAAAADSPLEEEEVSSTTKVSHSQQMFGCVLCGFKAPSISHIVRHIQDVHNTSNANFICHSVSGNSNAANSSEEKAQEGQFGNSSGTKKDSFEVGYCRCDSCSKEFPSRAALVRHTMRERYVVCGLCNFSSCCDATVSSHMYSSHKEGWRESPFALADGFDGYYSPSHSSGGGNLTMPLESDYSLGGEMTSLSTTQGDGSGRLYKLVCNICHFNAASDIVLARHLESHDVVRVDCGECGLSRDTFNDLHEHAGSMHPDKVSRISVMLKSASSDSPSSVYMFMLSPPSRRAQPNSLETPTLSSAVDVSKEENVKISFSEEDPCVADEEHLYACSECGCCLTGTSQLDSHIEFHLSTAGSVREVSKTDCGRQSYQFTTSSLPSWPRRGTQEFRCHQCGFWRGRSGPVVRHIQAVHMSGTMLHSRRLKSGRDRVLSIRVFTPLSSLASLG